MAGAALVVLVATVCWGVLTRYVTATPAAWTGDISSVAFAWLIFMGGAAAFKHGMHMSIDILWVRLPAPVRRWLGAAVDALVLAFLGYVTWLGVGFCLESMDDPLPILRWPRAILYAAVVAGFACMLLRYLGIALRRFRGRPEPGDAAGEGDAGWA
ncbi:TRAP-type C4-dicarboxylate transport system small permease component-like protein [Salipiger mucosus DSM 16094]|uniref:TRAP transporter small permease protein n=1 Tax=Salipiger mucosus DSM 16094 TaxID=1123237 RepID=S9Q3C7_9RHOB|nr:TRAP-type C4-dicarboxylate transport system small permease component-like protein [Salipiger mucosus DSM 16094]